MNQTFEPGEIAIMQNAKLQTKYNNEECEILFPYTGDIVHAITGEVISVAGYIVRAFVDGNQILAEHHQLRKKKPPTREMDTIVKWEDCLWQPNKTKEMA